MYLFSFDPRVSIVLSQSVFKIFEMTPAVAFSVRLHEDTEINDSPCVFGTVNLNIGNGYDEFTDLSKYITKILLNYTFL